MSNNTIQTETDEEIDIKEIFRILYRYKFMIIFLLILFGTTSSYIAYFKPNIYQASSTVEVGIEDAGGDMLNMAMNTGGMNGDTEMEIIKSRFLTEKAMKTVNFSHFYYTTRNFKEIELYEDAPFEVGMLKGYGISFDFYPVDEKSYRLAVKEAVTSTGAIWSYDEILLYGKEIDTEYFHLNIIKTKEAEDAQYRFRISKQKSLQGSVSVSLVENSTILEISYTDNVPLRAQEYVNSLAEAYIAQNVERKTGAATLKLSFIDKQLKRITENLKSSAIKVEEFKKTAKTVDLSSKAQIVIQRIAEYETKLTEITIDEEMLNSVYKQVKSGRNIETISILGVGMAESSVASMVNELQRAIMKKRALRQDYTEMYPEVIKLRKLIVILKKNIVVTIKNLRESVKEKKALVEKSILEQQKFLNTLPADERMFGQLQRKFVVNEKIYSYLLEKRLETAVVKASTVSKNRILDSALIPGGAIKPKRTIIILIGLILGFILGVSLAFLRAFLDDRIKGEDDIRGISEVPLLGLIPHIKRDDGKIKVFLSPKSAVAEAFRNVRTNLQFMSNYKSAHTIAVTSTVGGEGKTTVCINLAGIMSMSGKKTVLLNLDMRKPTLHEKFGLPNKQGMSTLLSGSTSLGKVIQKTEYEDLDIITSGPVPPNPSELIQGELMGKVLEKLKEVYDVIILDTPPVGLVVDAKTLMHLVDTSIYVMRADYSKKGFLKSIKEVSSLKEIDGLSVLLNDVKQGNGGYGYGYGYGYYEEDKK